MYIYIYNIYINYINISIYYIIYIYIWALIFWNGFVHTKTPPAVFLGGLSFPPVFSKGFFRFWRTTTWAKGARDLKIGSYKNTVGWYFWCIYKYHVKTNAYIIYIWYTCMKRELFRILSFGFVKLFWKTVSHPTKRTCRVISRGISAISPPSTEPGNKKAAACRLFFTRKCAQLRSVTILCACLLHELWSSNNW